MELDSWSNDVPNIDIGDGFEELLDGIHVVVRFLDVLHALVVSPSVSAVFVTVSPKVTSEHQIKDDVFVLETFVSAHLDSSV